MPLKRSKKGMGFCMKNEKQKKIKENKQHEKANSQESEQRNAHKCNKYHKYLWYFIIFSLIGLSLEIIFCFVGERFFKTSTGFVLGPLCYIYGFVAIIIIIGLKRFQGHKVKLFILASILGAVMEYSINFITESILGVKLWDCSWTRFNINRRIYLQHALLFGIMAVISINIIIKYLDKIINKMQKKEIMIVDIILTIIVILLIMFTIWGIITYTVRAKEMLNGKNYISNNNIIEKFQNTVFSNEVMGKIFPRLKIIDNSGNIVLIKNING